MTYRLAEENVMARKTLLAILILAVTLSFAGCAKEHNAYTVSSKWKSVPVFDNATGKTVGQAYKGFAVPMRDVKDGNVFFYFTVSDPSAPSVTKTLQFYIPVKYMQKSTEPLVAVPAIISLDMIRINAGACISILRDSTPECVIRFDNEIGSFHFIYKTDNGYQFTLGLKVVYVAERDATFIKYVD